MVVVVFFCCVLLIMQGDIMEYCIGILYLDKKVSFFSKVIYYFMFEVQSVVYCNVNFGVLVYD